MGAMRSSSDLGSLAPHAGDSERMVRLIKTIEGEIVPRLVLSRVRKVAPVEHPVAQATVEGLDELDVKEFVRLLLSHDSQVASAYVDTVRQRGVALESICLDLLARAARELGLLWEEDQCDFMQVTVGLCRLHQVLRELSPAFECDSADGEDRSVLLASYPGEQHTFGVTLVAQFLRRAGWAVVQECPRSVEELIGLASETSYTLVGVSVGRHVPLDELAQTIRRLRETSRNRLVGVLLGGPMFVARPDLASGLGADATAANGCDAVLAAQLLCKARTRFGKTAASA